MTNRAERLLEEALKLAPRERARLAAELLSSLDEQDADVKAAWSVRDHVPAAEDGGVTHAADARHE